MGAPTPPRPPARGPRPTPRPVPLTREVRAAALERGANGNGTSVPLAPSPSPAPVALASAPAVEAVVPGYLPALDGLRAVSVAAVVAYHLGELPGGFLGVDVFFVISGFLITRLLLAERERTGRVALGAFWVRRFKRLLPALFVAVVFVAIGSRLWLPAFRLGDIRADALAALAYVANWRFIFSGQSYFGSGLAPSPLRHTWSLAIEEQFYVFWPLISVAVVAAAKLHARRVVAVVAGVGTVASAAWMAYAASADWDLSRIYYGTDTRAFALFAGAWLATWWDPARQRSGPRLERRKAQRWSVVGAVAFLPVLAMFVLGTTEEAAFYQGGFQAMAVLSVLLVAGVAAGHGPLVAVLAQRPLVWLGRRSYGIYLWSWPIQVFASEHFRLEGAALIGAVVVFAVGLAALSHWLVEEPVRTGTRPRGLGRRPAVPAPDRPERSRPVVVAMSLLAVVGVVGVVVGTSAGAPDAPDYTSVSDEEALEAAIGPSSDEARALLESTTTTTRPEPDDPGPPGPFTAPGVTYVVPSSASVDPSVRLGRPMNVMIAGDSVGWSIGWKLGGLGLTESVRPSDRALIGCGVMPQTSKFIIGDAEPEQYSELCLNADLAEANGLTEKPDVVLLWLGAWEVYDHEVDGRVYEVGTDEFAEVVEGRIQERIDRYRSVGVPTVLALVPCFAPNAARLGNERLQEDRVEWVNDRLRKVAKRNRGWVRLIDPYNQLCKANGDPITATPEGIPLREDGSHFDPPAAVWFWNTWLAGQLGAAFDLPPAPEPTTTTSPPAAPSPSSTTVPQ